MLSSPDTWVHLSYDFDHGTLLNLKFSFVTNEWE